MKIKTDNLPKGYAQKPWELFVLPWIFLAAPLLNWIFWWIIYQIEGSITDPIQILTINFGTYDKGVWGMIRVISLLVPWILSLVSGVGLWRVRPWGFWVCAVTGLFAWFASAWNFSYIQGSQEVLAPNFDPLKPAALANLLFFLPVLFLLQRDLVAPFFESHLRWWEQHKRLRLSLPLEVQLLDQTKTVKTFDLSLHGCFIEQTEEWPLGQSMKAALDLMDGGAKVQMELKVLWKTGGSRHYPAGIGCQFHFNGSFPRQRLELFLKRVIQEGQKPHIRA